MSAHLFAITVDRSGTDMTSLYNPPDSNYFVDGSITIVNDGSFALDASTPVEFTFDNTNNPTIFVNFPTPLNLKKVLFQNVDGKSYFTSIQAGSRARAYPNADFGSGTWFSVAATQDANGKYLYGERDLTGWSDEITRLVETVRFNFSDLDSSNAIQVGTEPFSLRLGFVVEDAVSSKLIANNGLTRTFYQKNFTTLIPSWSDHLKLQLVSSKFAATGGSTTVSVKKVA